MNDSNNLIAQLIEIRARLLKMLLSIVIVFLALAYFAQDIYHWLASPLLAVMPDGTNMIATDVASPFFAPFKLMIVASFFIAIPFFF